MDTINGKPIHEFVDASEGKEIRGERRVSIGRIRKSLHAPYGKLRLGSYFDKDQRSGKVKQYTKKEIGYMNIINDLSIDDGNLFDFLLSLPYPSTKQDIVNAYKKCPSWMGETSNGIKKSLDYLACSGLVEKISMTPDGLTAPYKRGLKAFFKVVPPDKFQEPKPAGEENQVPAKPEEEKQPPQEAVTLLQDYISQWMDVNDVFELSITIKKRG
jgi:hypothetical protein